MAPSEPAIDLTAWGQLVLLSLLWGGSFLFIGMAVKELSPLVVVFARVTLAALVLVPVHLLRIGPLPTDRQSLLAFLGMSLLNNVIPFTLIVTGQTMIASGLASVINATTPIFGAVVMALAGEERLIARRMVALAVGIAGVAVLKGTGLAKLDQQGLGIALVLMAAASYALSSLWVKRRGKGISPLTMATGQLISSSLIMAVLAFTFSDPGQLLHASAYAWSAVLGLALLATAVAYILFFSIIARAGAANVLLVTMMIPVSAIIFGHVFLKEALSAQEFVGALIIGLALLVFDGRPLRLLGPGKNPA